LTTYSFAANKGIEGDFLTSKSVSKVKNMVEDCIGQKVRFKQKKGKNRSLITEGIIGDTYPSIFTVLVENKGVKRVMSFNYIDVITNYVEIFIDDDENTRII
jgi:uncharacterized protein Veg